MNSTGLCHCGSQQKYTACCEPYLKQVKMPTTAEGLMRSRYSAFVEGDVDYIMATHDPSTRSQVSAKDIGEWARNSEWKGLEILNVKDGGPEDRTAQMEFIARYKQKGIDVEHRERSDFRRRDDGRWYFVQGRVGAHETLQREAPKVGRNDPCPCGSGEKYKKCCAA